MIIGGAAASFLDWFIEGILLKLGLAYLYLSEDFFLPIQAYTLIYSELLPIIPFLIFLFVCEFYICLRRYYSISSCILSTTTCLASVFESFDTREYNVIIYQKSSAIKFLSLVRQKFASMKVVRRKFSEIKYSTSAKSYLKSL